MSATVKPRRGNYGTMFLRRAWPCSKFAGVFFEVAVKFSGERKYLCFGILKKSEISVAVAYCLEI